MTAFQVQTADVVTGRAKVLATNAARRPNNRARWAAGVAAALLLVAGAGRARAADTFRAPTPEELKMTSIPGYPGASAVVLFDEEITKDDLHAVQHYKRVKILTEEGKKYANVELNYTSTQDTGREFEMGDDKTMGDIQARTIHADGTIIPFTGKPYLKTMVKGKDFKYQSMVFTLPDVEVGSILEYRYATRYNDQVYESPSWYIQGDLYVKEAHYQWYPTTRELSDQKGRQISAISWFPILPEGAKIEHTTLPQHDSFSLASQIYELKVHDVPPQPKEDHMPPISAYSYRVLFNFTPFLKAEEYWKDSGKDWSKKMDSFAGPNGDLKKATQEVIAGAATPEDKLKKIYAAVMALENTGFTREHDAREDKAEGGGKVNNAAEVLVHKRGTATQLTLLFIGMARAAGLEADAMLVPDRSREVFSPQWLSFEQFDDVIAVVKVDGKDEFFDPGSRYCAFGQLEWQHTWVGGLRQVQGGTSFAQTTGTPLSANRTARVANLKMDEHGQVTGRIDMTYTGSAALRWRHVALRGDDESLRRQLKESLQAQLPRTLELTVAQIDGLTDYDKPLKVAYTVTGSMGTQMGKRVVLPVDLFTTGEAAMFPEKKRELAVYFDYPQVVLDALRINLPPTMTVEAVPGEGTAAIPQRTAYKLTTTSTANSFTTRRDFEQAEVLYPVKDYETLRGFYADMQAKDGGSVVLKAAPVVASSAAPAP